MLCTTLSDGKQTCKAKRTACSSVAPVASYGASTGRRSGLHTHPSAARPSGALRAVTTWLLRHSHTTVNVRLRSAAAPQHRRQALKGHTAARAAPDTLGQALRSPADVLMAVGMSRDAAEAALRQAAGDDSAAAVKRQSPVPSPAQSAARSDADGSAAEPESAQHSSGAEQALGDRTGEDHNAVCTEQKGTVSLGQQAWVSGSLVTGSEQLLQTDRIAAAVQGLLDAGIPVRRLAAVIAAHPAALAADPVAEWKPRVRRKPMMSTSLLSGGYARTSVRSKCAALQLGRIMCCGSPTLQLSPIGWKRWHACACGRRGVILIQVPIPMQWLFARQVDLLQSLGLPPHRVKHVVAAFPDALLTVCTTHCV